MNIQPDFRLDPSARFVPTFHDSDTPLIPGAGIASGDDALLDAYSRTISSVVDHVAPMVVNIRVVSGERGQGSGSGFIIARMASS